MGFEGTPWRKRGIHGGGEQLRECIAICYEGTQRIQRDRHGGRKKERLEFASEDLQGDKEVVMVTLENQRRAFTFASSELKRDCNIVDTLRNPSYYTWDCIVSVYFFIGLAKQVVSSGKNRKCNVNTSYARNKEH